MSSESEPVSSDAEHRVSQTDVDAAVATLRNAGSTGANWFYWIAGLSLVNTAMTHGGADRHFIVGLGVTTLVDAISMALAKENPADAQKLMLAGIVVSVVVAALCIGVGFLANRRWQFVFGFGMAIYLLDGLLYLLFGDYLSAAFHGYVLYCMGAGFLAYRKLSKLESMLAHAEVEPA